MDGGGHDIAHPVRHRTRPAVEARFAHWLRDTFKIPSGMGAGEPFALHPFQMAFLRQYLAVEVDGPLWRTCIFSTPRKLGKSTLLGALLLGRMCEDSPIYLPGFTGAVAAPSQRSRRDCPVGIGREGQWEPRVGPALVRGRDSTRPVELGDAFLFG